jgi:hypothetical protein
MNEKNEVRVHSRIADFGALRIGDPKGTLSLQLRVRFGSPLGDAREWPLLLPTSLPSVQK